MISDKNTLFRATAKKRDKGFVTQLELNCTVEDGISAVAGIVAAFAEKTAQDLAESPLQKAVFTATGLVNIYAEVFNNLMTSLVKDLPEAEKSQVIAAFAQSFIVSRNQLEALCPQNGKEPTWN